MLSQPNLAEVGVGAELGNKCCRTYIEIVSKYIESCRTKSIQEFYVMLVTMLEHW